MSDPYDPSIILLGEEFDVLADSTLSILGDGVAELERKHEVVPLAPTSSRDIRRHVMPPSDEAVLQLVDPLVRI